MRYSIILASGSPRRRELMDRLGCRYYCIPSSKEEDMSGHDPKAMVEMLAAMKAEDIAGKLIDNTLDKDNLKYCEAVPDTKACVIIGCDTVVAIDGAILGKPSDKDDAFRMIKSYTGRTHHVHTGVCILIIENNSIVKKINYSVSTAVRVVNMTDAEILSYVETGEPMDKAGAYAIQGLFCPYIDSIEGDYYNIVGYPIASIYRTFRKLKIDLASGKCLS